MSTAAAVAGAEPDLIARREEFAAQLRHVADRIRLAAEIDAETARLDV